MLPALCLPLLALLASPLAAQREPAKPPGNASIEGVAVRAGSGEPLKKVRVILRKVEGRDLPLSTITAADGRFVFKDIEPGRYHFSAERNGYVRQEYGRRGSNRPGAVLALEAGQRLRDVVFKLIPAAVITGRVLDEDGEPMSNVNVQALRYRYVEDKRQLTPTDTTMTNDLGEYRLHGLAPGRYYLSAADASDRMLAGTIQVSGGSEPEEGHAPTYYPGVTDPAREYKLFALEELELGAQQDPAFLRKYEDRGELCRLQPGVRKTVQLESIQTEDSPR